MAAALAMFDAVKTLVGAIRARVCRFRSASLPAERGAFASLVARHPRLMATAAATARMRRLVRDNQVAAEWMQTVAAQADHLLTLPPLTPTSVHDPTETANAPLSLPLHTDPGSGKPAAPLDIARLFVLRIETLGIVWFATGDIRYRDRAKQELLAVCGFPDWQGDQFLVTAETMFGAAIGYDWLYDALSDGERQRVARALLTKGIEPGLAEFANDPPPHWPRRQVNWNLVCNGALMIAALSAAEADWPTALRIFELCRGSVAVGFDEYRPDGGWDEGPGYWHYATQYAVYLLDSLETALGEDLGLCASPGFGNTGLFRLHAAGPSGKLFNFADSEEEHSGGYWLFWLARHFHHPVDAWIERQHGKPHPMDLLWFDPDAQLPSSDRLPPCHCFRGIETAMLRGEWEAPETTYLGIKGGANDACDHAHYDLGSFVLDAGGVRWAIDLGPDDYHLPRYFEPEMRARYYRTSTLGHNTIVIGGQSQPPTAYAPIVFIRSEPGLSCVVLDLTAAYPGCLRARRFFALIDGRHVVIVDDITPAPDRPLAETLWQMHTRAAIEPRGASAALTQAAGEAGQATLFLRIVEPGRAFAAADATPSGPPDQNPNSGLTKLTIDLGAVAEPVRLTVILSLDEAACATLDVAGVIAPLIG